MNILKYKWRVGSALWGLYELIAFYGISRGDLGVLVYLVFYVVAIVCLTGLCIEESEG